jgi:clathrin heavy chain
MLQVAYTNGLMDMVMPYLIQFLRDYSGKVDTLMHERKEAQEANREREESKKAQEQAASAYMQLNPYLALPAPVSAQSDGPAGGGGYPASAFNGGSAYGMPQQF